MTSAHLAPTFILPAGLEHYLEARGAGVSTPLAAPTHNELRVELIAEADARRQDAPGMLLRSRLTAAAWVIWCSLFAIFVWQAGFVSQPVHPWLTGGMLIVCVGSLVLLTGSRALSERQLRLIEVGLFGATATQFIAYQTAWMLRSAVAADAVQLVSTFDGAVLGFAVLMLCYGLFMPNGWRRTTSMVIPGVIGPLAAAEFVCWLDPFVARTLSTTRLAGAGVALAACSGIAIFGTHVIAGLRQEAKRARKLGQYRLRHKLGHGGMGDVYLAEHQLLKRPCAIKTIRPQHADAQSLARFEREVRSMARLSHWHSVEIYDFGHTDDGTFFYVMEYLPGLNLIELVERGGPLPPGRVIRFLEQTCAALAEAHQHGLIHRDLKPANIIAAHRGGEFDVTKLLDFGLVLDGHTDALHSPFSGSPLYMSPEQARGDRTIDGRSDLYSLGAIGYFLLTGHPPFERGSLLKLILAHARDPVAPPSTLRTGVPEDLEQVLLCCLAKEPTGRYASAKELQEALLGCVDAGGWTQADAEQWWRENAPERLQ